MNKILFRGLLLVFLCIFAFSAWKLWGYYSNYHGGTVEYEDLRDYTEEVEPGNDDPKDPDKPHKCPIKVDFDKLAKINPDVVGWIYIDKHVNYPIVQAKDNDYYLHRTFEGHNNFSGAIFLDYLCNRTFDSTNSIVYGHNLKNGEMFGHLKRYYDKNYNEEANYKKHEFIWILTPERDKEYQVFAAREIDVEIDNNKKTVYHPAYMIEFEWDEDYEAYLKDAVKQSQYKTRTTPDPANPILTLSTCTSNSEAGRFIVQATLIQDNDHQE